MKFRSIFAAAALVSSALAMPTNIGSIFNQNKQVQGYPWGLGSCISDAQAQFIVKTFKSILTNPDRIAAAKTAAMLLDDNYVEISDSINVLDNKPVSPSLLFCNDGTLTPFQQGASSFSNKQDFINSVAGAPAVSIMNDLNIFHDCNKIGWQWLVDGLALDVSPVKGFNKLTVDPKTGIVKSTDLEFNSVAWGRNLGWTCTAPPPRS